MDHKFETSKTFEGPAGNSYAQLTILREQERADAIKKGLIDDPDKPKALEEAQIFTGTCIDMCPLYEREQREFQNDVKRWEVNPQTGRIDRSLAVKAFHRPAAGNEQALPSDVRPPKVLSQTLEYLIEKIVSPCDPLDKDTHGFVRDRTRSIRQDFTLQNERGTEAIACHERIVRFHILSLHHMCEIDGFDAHQEMEQLRKTLQSLAEYYDDQRENNIEHPHEAEFRAYHILTRLRDPDVLRHIQTLPREIRNSPLVIQALQLYRYAQRSNEEIGRFKPPNTEGSLNLYTRFFKLVGHKDTSYVMACLCEPQFNDVRKGALKGMRKAFISAVKPPSVDELVVLLGCDDQQEVEIQCEQYGIVVRPDDENISRPVLNKSTYFDESRPDLRQKFSHGLVEAKRGGLSFAQLIRGSNIPITAVTSPIAKARASSDKHSNFSFSQVPSISGHAGGPQSTRNSATTSSTPTQFGGFLTGKDQHSIAIPPPKLAQNWTAPDATDNDQDTISQPAQRAILPQPKDETASSEDVSKVLEVAKEIAKTTVQQMIRDVLQGLVKKNIAEHLEAKHKRAEVANQLTKDLYQGLVRDQLYTVACRTYADWWRDRRSLGNAWRAIKTSSLNVQHRRRIEKEKALAEQRRQEDYAAAFQELYQDQPVRSRKRRRSQFTSSSGATATSLLQAKDNAQKFWAPLDLSHYLSCAQLSDSTQTWKLLVSTTPSQSSSLQWFRTKFGVGPSSSQDQSIIERNHRIEIEIAHEFMSNQLAETAALIFQCSENADIDSDRLRLLSLVQRIAEESDRRFPILILKFGSIASEQELAQSLMVPEVLADRKSPVTACNIVGIESMADMDKFEVALDKLFRSTESQPSPLAMERAQKAERDTRRAATAQVQMKQPERTPRLRSSFYDTGVLSPINQNRCDVRSTPSQVPSHEIMPIQVSELMKNVQKSRELLSRSVN